MPKLAQSLLPTLDRGRAALDDFGLRPFTVALRRRTWSERIGVGTYVDSDTPITVANGRAPGVEEVENRDVVASGGSMTEATYRIGPLTPPYAGGGISPSDIDPDVNERHRMEVFFVLKGPSIPPSGVLCRRITDDTASPFGWFVNVQSLGVGA